MGDGSTVDAAVEAFRRGYIPLPILDKDKKPGVPQWTHLAYSNEEEVREKFTQWADQGRSNVGLLLGEPSGGLVDVDLDHPKAVRLRDYFLPPTMAKSGREGRRGTHYWYQCTEGTTPGITRQHLMPGEDGKRGPVAVELRSSKGQTVLPPSIHPSGEQYLWEGEPWGGDAGPAVVDGRVLTARVAMLGLASVLLDNWPQRGTRHEAYLALAGGLLSYGEMGVHPFWGHQANAAEQLIRALAEATLDDDGPDSRVAESVHSTIAAIQAGKRVKGLGSLVDIIGEDHVRQVRVLVAEVESAAGFTPRIAAAADSSATSASAASQAPTLPSIVDDGQAAALAPEERDPLGERLSTWQPVDLEPYLSGQVTEPRPTVLSRDDGAYLMYPGRVNMLYGSSESAKSWIALYAAMQVMATGDRVVYLDFEDEPVNTLYRLNLLGAGHDDIRKQFTYIRPEDPIAAMQRNKWGQSATTPTGLENSDIFLKVLNAVDPTLIIADGMSVIYGLHGLNTNDTTETDVITTWLKSLTRNGRSTVVVIDHTGKGAEKGSEPIGSQHKKSMVQGTLLQVWPLTQPRPGAFGEIELVVLKDRPGFVREIALSSGGQKAQVAALVQMDSTTPGRVDMKIKEPTDPAVVAASGVVNLAKVREAERQQKYRDDEEAIKRLYRGKLGAQLSMLEISASLPDGFVWRSLNADGKWSAWKGDGAKAMKRLVEQGWVVPVGQTKDRKYELAVGSDGYDLDGPDSDDD